jgi:AcrR family transcriptional regulator
MLALYDEGHVKPGAAQIAERAGLSERSVFRHFEDLEDLARAALETQMARIAPFFEPPSTEGTLADRVAALADHRLRLHDRAMPGARAGAMVAARSATVAEGLDARRRLLRRQVEHHFADDLDRRGGTAAERAEVVAALDAASSLEAVEFLRTHAHLAHDDARAVLVRTLTTLLAPDPAPEHP